MLFYIIIFVSTFFSVYHLMSSIRFEDRKVLYKVEQKGMTILVPCYNEAPLLKYTIDGILNIQYNQLEVIIINDGSEDHSLELLKEFLELYPVDRKSYALAEAVKEAKEVKDIYQSRKHPFIYVIDKENSGKAKSLNVGVLFSHHDLIVTLDGDCVLEEKALLNMNDTFDDEEVIASGGVVHIMQMFKLNQKLRLIVLMQALDYIKGFYVYKASLAHNNALSIISGAFGVFRKNVLLELGGFKAGLGEDIDITLRMQEYAKMKNKKVVFNKNAICYTECPESLKGLIGQRVRWHKGFIDAILNNSIFLFKNVFGTNVCFYIIFDALLSNTFATVVFIFNIILICTKVAYGYSLYVLIYYLTTVIFNIVSSIIAIRCAKKNVPHLKTKLLYWMIIYDMTLFQILRIYFFLKGTATYYFDNKHWHKVVRTNHSYKV